MQKNTQPLQLWLMAMLVAAIVVLIATVQGNDELFTADPQQHHLNQLAGAMSAGFKHNGTTDPKASIRPDDPYKERSELPPQTGYRNPDLDRTHVQLQTNNAQSRELSIAIQQRNQTLASLKTNTQLTAGDNTIAQRLRTETVLKNMQLEIETLQKAAPSS